MRVVRPGDPTYDSDRRIANARFDYRPRYIFYCENTRDVQSALRQASLEKLGVRIRSGGHQHEGMCSANGVVMVDLSEIHGINFSRDLQTAWIGSGTKLVDLYSQLLARNRILPGGGCGDVRIGGLIQGGGWGPYSRAFGLTCDRLEGFRMVMASGEAIEVGANTPQYKDLVWAVRGAGGGNFGVITEFLVSLADVSFPIWQFTLTWSDPDLRQPVMEEWRANFPNESDFTLTSFCRVSGARSEDPPIIVAGYYLKNQPSLEALLRQLLPKTYSKCKPFFGPVRSDAAPEAHLAFHHPEYQPGPPLAARRAVSAALEEAPPKETCDGGYYPHKVSSCFPGPKFSAEATLVITQFLESKPPDPNARRYLSLHCMGGAIGDQGAKMRSCFPFRDKPFMVQYQAWWADPNDKPLAERCLAWVRAFRETMKPYTEGAFINFPDKDLVPNPDTPDGRKALLRYYYAGNLDVLITLKRKYDPADFFNFEMGIPTR